MSIAELTGINVPTDLLIGGEWTKGSATFPVLDPATEEPLAEVADGTAADALDAVAAAQAALPGWAGPPPRQRAEILRRAFELMTERAEQFARLMSAENGKSLRDARGEAAYAAEFFRWCAEEAVRIEGSVHVVNPSSPGPVVAAIMNDSRVRKMSFTGSTEVGRILLGQAAHSVM